MSAGQAIERLVKIMARLRGPDGCPWDHEQTLETLKPYLIEETYEVLEVMGGAADEHRDELGDLLFQIIFQSRIREERGEFSMADVADAISDKLERRHPHVFAGVEFADRDALKRNWAEIKAQEIPRESVLDGIPKAMPAMLRAYRLGEKAAAQGFDWPEASQVLDKIDEEREELAEAMQAEGPDAIADELGDLLFTVVNLSRHLQVDPEAALRRASAKFERRFRAVEAALKANGQVMAELSADDLDAAWQKGKRR